VSLSFSQDDKLGFSHKENCLVTSQIDDIKTIKMETLLKADSRKFEK